MIGGLELLRNFLSNLTGQPGFAWVASAIRRRRPIPHAHLRRGPGGHDGAQTTRLVSGRTPTVALGKPHEIAAELVALGRG
ncbi:MAG: hypothetical protein WDN49_03830 [Acetobacteraceae bacterium]